VFDQKQDARRGKVHYNNLYLDGPEEWPHYAWGAYFARHESILARLTTWWKEKLLKEQQNEKRKESQK
jgi:hypothetical protein